MRCIRRGAALVSGVFFRNKYRIKPMIKRIAVTATIQVSFSLMTCNKADALVIGHLIAHIDP